MKTEHQELVSIVVPVYNVELYLKDCLDSLIGQTYQKIEILLIDDGSTDGSGEICDAFAKQDQRVKVWHKSNEGVSAARNHGIREAKGEWLIFVDSDDQAHRQLVEMYMEYAKEGKVLICRYATDTDFLNQKYGDDEQVRLKETSSEKFMELYYRNHIHPIFNKLYHAKILKESQLLFSEDKSLGEDVLFNLGYFWYAPKEYEMIPFPLYYYHEDRDGSLSTSYRRDQFVIQQSLFSVLEQFLKAMEAWNEESEALYYELYWDRLYLSAKMCRAYERRHPEETYLKEMLKAPVWEDIWKKCERRKLINWKRRIKAILLRVYRLL